MVMKILPIHKEIEEYLYKRNLTRKFQKQKTLYGFKQTFKVKQRIGHLQFAINRKNHFNRQFFEKLNYKNYEKYHSNPYL